MAIYDGKNIKGTIGNLAFRNVNGVTIVQSKPGKKNVKQTVATKKSASLFGRVTSPFARMIRQAAKILHLGFYDGAMVNRMNSAISVIMHQHLDLKGDLNFKPESFDRLIGFEFNLHAQLKDYLLIKPTVVFDATAVTVTFNEFEVYKNLKFPATADRCKLQMVLAYFCLTEGKWKVSSLPNIELDQHQHLAEAKSYTLPVYEDTLCLVLMGLAYFRRDSRQDLPVNSKLFNPVSIVGAHFKYGVPDLEEIRTWNNMAVKLNEGS